MTKMLYLPSMRVQELGKPHQASIQPHVCDNLLITPPLGTFRRKDELKTMEVRVGSSGFISYSDPSRLGSIPALVVVDN
jgi:hypothetical protein